MNVVLNELSLSPIEYKVQSEQEARNIIDQFVETLHGLISRMGIKSVIATDDFYSFYITPDYGIQEWLKDTYVKKKNKDYMRIVLGNKCTRIQKENYALSEFKVHAGETLLSGTGCLVAFELNGKTISLVTHSLWSEHKISGIHITLDPDTEEALSTETELDNIYSSDQVALLQDEVIEHTFQHISSGQDLWDNKAILFPYLEFCDSVKDQLIEDSQGFHIKQVLLKLQRMNAYFGDDDTQYDPQKLGMKARTESESVQQDPELMKQRLFRMPDGKTRYFFDHIGFTGNYCGRIHFLPDKANKKCYIGYIGKHLKTKRF
ncbi:hypothetical protein [Brevibacillus invocatus]|uniref:hypothetical protein n=1 Tax=Brevibacillus invocatus TaxID=173959 RepID=UPI00203EE3D6|nr:hypothetical protein [Brevibacillus invocatus]MCM3078537.1 hypothetical protein [Brevibacillus invocatus]MCM3429212.1 hypothetical protein [Brevibacillus invocatus]